MGKEICPCWGWGEIQGGSHGIKGEESDGFCTFVSRRGCRAFYSKPLVRRSLEIALAIATSAAEVAMKFASTCTGNDLGIPLILRRSY